MDLTAATVENESWDDALPSEEEFDETHAFLLELLKPFEGVTLDPLKNIRMWNIEGPTDTIKVMAANQSLPGFRIVWHRPVYALQE